MIGPRLKALRVGQGLTIRGMAERLSLIQGGRVFGNRVQSIERADSIGLDSLAGYLEALGLSAVITVYNADHQVRTILPVEKRSRARKNTGDESSEPETGP